MRHTDRDPMAQFRSRVYTLFFLLCTAICGFFLIRSRMFHTLMNPLPVKRASPLILMWDRNSHLVDFKPYRTKSEIPKKRLSCNCDITSDAGAWKLADAVLVNAFYLRRISNFDHFFPKRRQNKQLWIFYMLEPAQITTENREKHYFSRLNGQFNLTMTYRRDSDIPIGYGQIRPLYADDPQPVQPGKILSITGNKRHLVAWFVSNCQAKSARLPYVQELQKYLSVDIYGDCGPLKCPNATVKDCNQLLTSHYKFYLSFESSVCKDYITEKFFNPMQQTVIPVVLGGGNYSAINAPPDSYIDIRDFSSIKELADYLLFLNSSPPAYNAYFQWKQHFKVERNGVYSENLCHLCHKLQTIDSSPTLFQQVYSNMLNWWHEQAHCKHGRILNNTWIAVP